MWDKITITEIGLKSDKVYGAEVFGTGVITTVNMFNHLKIAANFDGLRGNW
jgi:hypothetical protein